YQNVVDCGGGFSGEERAWLSNFGCNNLEFFKAYNVKFNDRNVASLQKLVETLPAQISKLQEEVPSGEKARAKLTESIRIKQEVLANAKSELIKWSNENFEKLSEREKNLYRRAFVTN